jgi:hypothetical protein
MTNTEQKGSQFSLRSLVTSTAIGGASLALIIQLVIVSKRHGFFFAPFAVIGEAVLPFAALLFFASPILLLAVTILLYRRQPGPVFAYIFLACLSVAIFQAFASRPYVTKLLGFSQVMSPILVTLSISAMVEVIARKLQFHAITCGCVFLLALTYWLMTAVIVLSV